MLLALRAAARFTREASVVIFVLEDLCALEALEEYRDGNVILLLIDCVGKGNSDGCSSLGSIEGWI